MDNWFKSKFGNQIAVRHIFFESFTKETPLTNEAILPLLDDKKKFKYMAKQDFLGMYGASEIIKQSGLSKSDLQNKVGLGLANSYLPFHQDDLVGLIENSHRNNEFNLDEFITSGIRKIHPLTTFKCLPNMPMFHISVNFGIKNSYFIGYPNGLQMYHVLIWACCELQKKEIDFVLIGGIEDNLNFLVAQHYSKNKLDLPTVDRVGFIVLEKNITQKTSDNRTTFILEDLVCSNVESVATHRQDFASLPGKNKFGNSFEITKSRDKACLVSTNLNVCSLFENLNKSMAEKTSLELTVDDGMKHNFKMIWRIKSE